MLRILCFLMSMILSVHFSLGKTKMEWIKEGDMKEVGFYRNVGFTKKATFLGIILENNSDKDVLKYIKLNNPHINHVYLINQNGDTVYHTGDHLPFNSRPIKYWDYVLPIINKKASSDSLTLIMENLGEGQLFNIEIMSPTKFDIEKTNYSFLYGAIFSFSTIFSAIFLLIGLVNKEKDNIVFPFFMLSSTFWFYNINGLPFEFLWPNNTFIQHASRVTSSTLSISSFILYFKAIHEKYINKTASFVFNFFIGFLILRFLVAIGMPGLMNNHSIKYILLIIGSVIIILGTLFLIFIMITLYKKKDVFLQNIGFSLYLLFTLKEGLKLSGIDILVIPNHEEYLAALTIICLTAIFSLANLLKYRQKKKNEYLLEIETKHKMDHEITEKIIVAQEHERSSIGKNIHDQVGVLLSVLKVKLQTIRKKRAGEFLGNELDEMIVIINSCNEELHNIIDDLVPPEFEQSVFGDIIRNRIEMFEKNTDIEFNLDCKIKHIEDNSISLTLYRIISELIANSIKHAECSKINIEIFEQNNKYLLYYYDDGKGMDETFKNGSHGIKNIYNRINYLEGRMDLKTNYGHTEFLIEIPIGN